ncbi:MAG TPA: response regulator transcription factor [Chloroflexi bacterium]|nr:response regulator transcription factor [Chloroflexota bacterium]
MNQGQSEKKHNYLPLILIVEDDPDTQCIYADYLGCNGYRTLAASSGEEALALAQDYPPDLALLDIIMPGISGRVVAARLREQYPGIGIVFITAVRCIELAVKEMRQGALDYLVKPVRLSQLLETINEAWAVCRENARVQLGDLTIDMRENRATRAGNPVPLTPMEGKLLTCLARQLGQVTSYEKLWQMVWGCTGTPDKNLIQRTASNLRAKVGRGQLTCIWGQGYRLG